MIPGVKLVLVNGCVWSITQCERALKGSFVVLVSGVHLDNYKDLFQIFDYNKNDRGQRLGIF